MNKSRLFLIEIYLFLFIFLLFILNSYIDINSEVIIKYIYSSQEIIYEQQTNFFIIKSFVFSIFAFFFILFITKRYFKNVIKKLNKITSLFDNANDAVYVIRLEDGKVLNINKRACLMLGYSKKELLNKNINDFRKAVNADGLSSWIEEIENLKEKKYLSLRLVHIKKDGIELPVEVNISYLKNENEEYMIAVARDISPHLSTEEKIKSKAYKLQHSQDIISKSVLYTTSDLNGNITSTSKAFEQLSGYSQEELIGANHNIFRTPYTSSEFYKRMWAVLKEDGRFIGEIRNYTKDKALYWIKVTIDPLYNGEGEKVGYSSYQENITDKKELEYISSHDMLTGIYNRGEFTKQLSLKMKNKNTYASDFGLVMIDVDYFKSVNDTYGHQVGDSVLKTIAKSIKTHIRKEDILARWGGEEFVIIVNDSNLDDLKVLVMKLQSEIMKTSFRPVPYITVSFGLTLYRHEDTEHSIQKRADDALYEAKKNGRNRYEINL